ncbi:hypothetical protein Tco_0699192, partial [Tanacetum coccineum]
SLKSSDCVDFQEYLGGIVQVVHLGCIQCLVSYCARLAENLDKYDEQIDSINLRKRLSLCTKVFKLLESVTKDTPYVDYEEELMGSFACFTNVLPSLFRSGYEFATSNMSADFSIEKLFVMVFHKNEALFGDLFSEGGRFVGSVDGYAQSVIAASSFTNANMPLHVASELFIFLKTSVFSREWNSSVDLSGNQLRTKVHKVFVEHVSDKVKSVCACCPSLKELIETLLLVFHIEILLMSFHLSFEEEKHTVIMPGITSIMAGSNSLTHDILSQCNVSNLTFWASTSVENMKQIFTIEGEVSSSFLNQLIDVTPFTFSACKEDTAVDCLGLSWAELLEEADVSVSHSPSNLLIDSLKSSDCVDFLEYLEGIVQELLLEGKKAFGSSSYDISF